MLSFLKPWAKPNPQSVCRQTSRRKPRLQLEPLEDRSLPSNTATFTGGGSSPGWSDPDNWLAQYQPVADDDVVIQSGTLSVLDDDQFDQINNLALEPGSAFDLGGKTLAVVGHMSWSASTLVDSTASDDVRGTGALTVLQGIDLSGALVMHGGTLNNLFQAANWGSGAGQSFVGDRGAVFRCDMGGTVDIPNNLIFTEPDNYQGIRPSLILETDLSHAAGQVVFRAATLIVHGALQVADGSSVELDQVDGQLSGSFTVAGHAVLNFHHTQYTLEDGAGLFGTGSSGIGSRNIQVTGDSLLTVAGDVAVTGLALVGGTIAGPGSISVGSSQFVLLGGTLKDLTSLNILAGGTLAITSAPGLDGTVVVDNSVIRNEGNATWLGQVDVTFRNGAVFHNTSAGSFLIASDRQFLTDTLGATGALINEGILAKSGAPGATTVQIPFSNSGLLLVEGATLEFAGGFTQTLGMTALFQATLDAAQLDLQGGALVGVGVVNGNVDNSGGLVTPGFFGSLDVSGDYTQGANGTLAYSIGGPLAGAQFGLVQVAGEASLDGALALFFVNGSTLNGNNLRDLFVHAFTVMGIRIFNLADFGTILSYARMAYGLTDFLPQPADSFPVLTYGSRVGAFAHENGLALPNGLHLVPIYGGDNLTLSQTVRATGQLGDLIRVDLKAGLSARPGYRFDIVRAPAGGKMIDGHGNVLRANAESEQFKRTGVFFFAPNIYGAALGTLGTVVGGFRVNSLPAQRLEIVVHPGYSSFALSGSVGAGAAARNKRLDVFRVQQRLRFLNFRGQKPAKTAKPPKVPLDGNGKSQVFIQAIQLFQAVVKPNGLGNPEDMSGAIARKGRQTQWLSARNAPLWLEATSLHNSNLKSETWATSWTLAIIDQAAAAQPTILDRITSLTEYPDFPLPKGSHMEHKAGHSIDVGIGTMLTVPGGSGTDPIVLQTPFDFEQPALTPAEWQILKEIDALVKAAGMQFGKIIIGDAKRPYPRIHEVLTHLGIQPNWHAPKHDNHFHVGLKPPEMIR